MQTFLPYPDFAKSAACLDNKRLGKQRVECGQIMNALLGYRAIPLNGIETKPFNPIAWVNHPATLMWKGYEKVLALYALDVCKEWVNRDCVDTYYHKFRKLYTIQELVVSKMPPWLGNERFHAGHRSNLLRKAPDWYGQFGWQEDATLPYVWPTHLLAP